MKKFKFQLDMNHTGLGKLNEYRLLVLFANKHSLYLTAGLPHNPDQILNKNKKRLYPAYFMTHLIVPAQALLESFQLWDDVEVGVDIKRFGDTIIDSRYILGKENEVPEEFDEWEKASLPYMKSNSLFIIDVTETKSPQRQVSVPDKDLITNLEKVSRPPEAILKSKDIRSRGFSAQNQQYTLSLTEPICYILQAGRDVDPGHTVMFAKFTEIMDLAVRQMLNRLYKPGLPDEILDYFSVLERETYYFGNCLAGEVLEIYMKGNLSDCLSNFHGNSMQYLSAAFLDLEIAVYQQRGNILLTMSRVKKLLILPIHLQEFFQDINRILIKK